MATSVNPFSSEDKNHFPEFSAAMHDKTPVSVEVCVNRNLCDGGWEREGVRRASSAGMSGILNIDT